AVAGKVFEKRRPPLALRVCALGEPAARVILGPHWLNNHGVLELVRGKMHVELIVLTLKYSGKLVPVKRLGFLLGNGEPQVRRCYPKTVTEDLARLFETVAAFVSDPIAAFRRSTDHCAICGRCLSDGNSRARGIGPCCLENTSFFRGGWE